MNNRHIDGFGKTGGAEGRGGLGRVYLPSGLWVQTVAETQKKEEASGIHDTVPCEDSGTALERKAMTGMVVVGEEDGGLQKNAPAEPREGRAQG